MDMDILLALQTFRNGIGGVQAMFLPFECSYFECT